MSWNDTLDQTKALQKAGFTREQAETIVLMRWRNPSMMLVALQETDLTRRQAEAILDYMWSQKISLIPRSPILGGFIMGAAVALMIFGFIFLVDVLPFANALHH